MFEGCLGEVSTQQNLDKGVHFSPARLLPSGNGEQSNDANDIYSKDHQRVNPQKEELAFRAED